MVQQKILGELVRYFRIPLIVTSIIGNIAVIVVLLRYKVLRRNSSNMLIAQLGFADFVLGAAWTYGYRFYFMVFTALTSLLTIDYMLGELIKLKEVSALTVITIAAYLHQTHVSAQRRENSIVITQTTVMVSYMVFWCVPTIVYLVAMAVGFHANIFGNITLVFSIGSASFASLNPFLTHQISAADDGRNNVLLAEQLKLNAPHIRKDDQLGAKTLTNYPKRGENPHEIP
ncbi:unnamed protein product [Toxocara canis]|uniref:G_PROTEIN_RECEP_F1_2 domain-containing protein n=1 Tax=Toxocara canis TaxID=6265 RepID=A0A183UBF4_TOXCA|nr:unnamed protein product [Toxocara canis]